MIFVYLSHLIYHPFIYISLIVEGISLYSDTFWNADAL